MHTMCESAVWQEAWVWYQYLKPSLQSCMEDNKGYEEEA